MKPQIHSVRSSYREMLLEHLFLGEVLRSLWKAGVYDVEVLKPQVDDAGYDLVIECNGVARHVQLKSTHHRSRVARVNINVALAVKQSGCVIWIVFDESTLSLGPFRWFGGEPGSPLPSLRGLKVAKHTKGDSTGKKAKRPNIRVLPKGRFEELSTIGEVVGRLFGPMVETPSKARNGA